jgi:hypothetical protein
VDPLNAIAADSLVYNARDHGLAADGVSNDQPALAKLVDALGAACVADGLARAIYCPPGVYSIRDGNTVWRSGVSLIGAGTGATRFVLSNRGNPTEPVPLAYFTTREHGADREHHIADCTFARFEIDGSDVSLEAYTPLAKGLGLQYVLRGRFRDLYIHDTGGSGLGCDFLQDTVVEGVIAENCGRLDSGEDMGGAGIGIGIGGWGTMERLTVAHCTAVGNGTNGIFVELQREYWPPPRGIYITGCHADGNRYGISDWGADGLVVSGCTMTANHVAGYDVSAQGTSSVAGRGGILTGCLIDGNVRDGVVIGNTPGPYTITGNRISSNGRHGYREHNLAGGDQEPARDIVLDGNEIFDNALDGIHVDGALTDATLLGNRVRRNGRRAEPATSGEGDTVSCTATSLTDTAAAWLADGHRGKTLTVGDQVAVVTFNTRTELALAPSRPGATTAWPRGTPPAGAAYSLPGAPAVRAGIALAAPVEGPTLQCNHIWDNQVPKTQTHGLWITKNGTCVSSHLEHNDLLGNAVAAVRFDNAPIGGCWHHNHGVDDPV